MIHIGFDPSIRLGDLVATATLGGLVYAVKKAYKGIMHFVKRQNDNEDELKATSKMVDRHSRAMMKAGLIGPPVEAVHHARRSGDATLLDPREQEIRT